MNTKQLRRSILSLAIRGRLVPQDPDDEPAIELLKRINPKAAPLHEEVPFSIPESWVWTTLGDISNYGCCESTDVNSINPTDWVLELEDIEKGSARVIKAIPKSERKIKGVRHKFHKGQILYSKLRTYLNKVLVAQSDGFCTTEIIPIEIEEIISPQYMLYVLRSNYFVNYTLSCVYGMKMPRLGTRDARKGLVPLPPLAEQERIVKEVERWFACIEQLERSREALGKAARQTKRHILSLAISGRLVPQDPNDEPASELLKRINPKFTPLPTDSPLPPGWTACGYKDIFSNITSKPYQILQSQIKETGKNPVISQSASYIEGYSDEDCLLQHDEPLIVFGDHTKVVKYVDFDFVVGADGVKVIKPLINRKYAFYLLLYASTHIYDRGYARHFSLISKFVFLVPPLAEQERIVQKVEELFAVLDALQ